MVLIAGLVQVKNLKLEGGVISTAVKELLKSVYQTYQIDAWGLWWICRTAAPGNGQNLLSTVQTWSLILSQIVKPTHFQDARVIHASWQVDKEKSLNNQIFMVEFGNDD